MPKRQRVSPNEPTRNYKYGLRFTQAEYALLQVRAAEADMVLSVYIRERALSDAVDLSEPEPQMSYDLVVQLKKIGTNLNQIAHAMNTGTGTPPELHALCQLIEHTVLEHTTHGAPSGGSR